MPHNVDFPVQDKDSDASNHPPMKSRKRTRDISTPEGTPAKITERTQPDLPFQASKRRCSELGNTTLQALEEASRQAILPSSSFSVQPDQPPPTSAKHDALNAQGGPQSRKASSRASPQSEPKPSRRSPEQEDIDNESFAHDTDDHLRKSSGDSTSTWVEHWIATDCPTISPEQAAEALDILPSIEPTEDDQMSRLDGPSQKSESINTSNPAYHEVLSANGVIIDETGKHIPPDVQALIDKHFRQDRHSPRLGTEDLEKVRDNIVSRWKTAEPTMSKIFVEPIFPTSALPPKLAEGGDTPWNWQALPRDPKSQFPISQPKPDYHIGFPTFSTSSWDINERHVAEHTFMTPYSKPTYDNLFPSYLREIKSEARGGTLFAAEGQLAGAGAHRVNSWLWILDQIDPNRERSSADAVVFSDASSQRLAVAYVHYFNPKDGLFYMSYFDDFYLFNNVQRFRDHIKNAMDWMLNTQQPMIRDALRRLEPISKTWKKGRPASVATGQGQSDSPADGSQRSGKFPKLQK